jgi:23S rRNA U2552 (ribose-2'-O)-methylase RlmE/FtsJ
MEVLIFKPGEISIDVFIDVPELVDGSGVFKDPKYGNFVDLDTAKCMIDTLDRSAERLRRAAVKYLHEYELVKTICKKNVVSRAYFKLYELVYFEKCIYKESLDCFFICEAPGGFIEALHDIRRKKNLQTKWISISKQDREIKYDNYFDERNIYYGDLTIAGVLKEMVEITHTRFPNKCDFITADGGFSVKSFNDQERILSKLLLCEIYLALHTQRQHGTFIIKFFDMFTHNTHVYYLLLCSLYQSVKIIKPNTSRNCNSERYLVCTDFQCDPVKLESLLHDLLYIIKNFNDSTIVYPTITINDERYIKKIRSFNNVVLYEQVKTINDSLRMVNHKNYYFQQLLLKIFSDKKIYIPMYKNILGTRIKKCTDFLCMHNINSKEFL